MGNSFCRFFCYASLYVGVVRFLSVPELWKVEGIPHSAVCGVR